MRKEVYATVLAACWHRQRFRNFLTVEIGLSRVVSTFRWDLSASCVILTQEDSPSPSLIFDNDRAHYRALDRELVASFNQARRVPVERADPLRPAETPTTEEVRRLFARSTSTCPAPSANGTSPRSSARRWPTRPRPADHPPVTSSAPTLAGSAVMARPSPVRTNHRIETRRRCLRHDSSHSRVASEAHGVMSGPTLVPISSASRVGRCPAG